MLDGVAIYLVGAPVLITAGLLGLFVAWLSRNGLAAARVSRRRKPHP